MRKQRIQVAPTDNQDGSKHKGGEEIDDKKNELLIIAMFLK